MMGAAPREFRLHAACSQGDTDQVIKLLQEGWEPNELGSHGSAPLHHACAAGHGGVVALLLAAGADPSGPAAFESECTPLHVAAACDNHVAVAALIAAGAQLDTVDRAGDTAASIARQRGSLVCLSTIEKASNRIAKFKQTPRTAVPTNETLDGPAHHGYGKDGEPEPAGDPSPGGLIGDRALQLFSAVSLGDQNEVERLVAQGEPVNVELPAEIDGWSYLSPLALAVCNGAVDIAAVLLAAGADPNATSIDTAGVTAGGRSSKGLKGWTALHHAANLDDGPCTALLLEAGCDPMRLSPTGETVWQIARRRRSAHVLEALTNWLNQSKVGSAVNSTPAITREDGEGAGQRSEAAPLSDWKHSASASSHPAAEGLKHSHEQQRELQRVSRAVTNDSESRLVDLQGLESPVVTVGRQRSRSPVPSSDSNKSTDENEAGVIDAYKKDADAEQMRRLDSADGIPAWQLDHELRVSENGLNRLHMEKMMLTNLTADCTRSRRTRSSTDTATLRRLADVNSRISSSEAHVHCLSRAIEARDKAGGASMPRFYHSTDMAEEAEAAALFAPASPKAKNDEQALYELYGMGSKRTKAKPVSNHDAQNTHEHPQTPALTLSVMDEPQQLGPAEIKKLSGSENEGENEGSPLRLALTLAESFAEQNAQLRAENIRLNQLARASTAETHSVSSTQANFRESIDGEDHLALLASGSVESNYQQMRQRPHRPPKYDEAARWTEGVAYVAAEAHQAFGQQDASREHTTPAWPRTSIKQSDHFNTRSTEHEIFGPSLVVRDVPAHLTGLVDIAQEQEDMLEQQVQQALEQAALEAKVATLARQQSSIRRREEAPQHSEISEDSDGLDQQQQQQQRRRRQQQQQQEYQSPDPKLSIPDVATPRRPRSPPPPSPRNRMSASRTISSQSAVVAWRAETLLAESALSLSPPGSPARQKRVCGLSTAHVPRAPQHRLTGRHARQPDLKHRGFATSLPASHNDQTRQQSMRSQSATDLPDEDDAAIPPQLSNVTGPAAELYGHLFDILDADGSGKLDKTEGKEFLRICGVESAEPGERVYLGDDPSSLAELDYYWDDLLRRADHDNDGKISRSEFLEYVLENEQLERASGNFVDQAHAQYLKGQLAALQEQASPLSSSSDGIADGDKLRLSPRTP